MDDQNNSEDDIQEVVVQEVGYDTSSSPYSDIVDAILLIPATLIVISFFSLIYRIFINRRLRS